MLNTVPQGGWGAGAATAPNPFSSVTPPPGNPFSKPPANPFQNSNVNTQTPATNPFLKSTASSNPFSAATTSSFKPSAQTRAAAVTARNPFEQSNRETSAPGLLASRPSALAGVRRSSPRPVTNDPRTVAEFVKPAWPNGSTTPVAAVREPADTRRRKSSLGRQGNGQNGVIFSTPAGMAVGHGVTTGFGAAAQSTVPNRRAFDRSSPNPHSHDGRSYELARKIQQQLSKDRIKPPQWPANPGSHTQRQAMENFRESYKTYREKARKSLIRAGLIDDPDQRRTLQQALDFRGISEEMCPEWEKITRIIEYDVRNPEKAPDDSGDLVATPSLMVKRLARSAAGQDAPLPMDVRSFATLRATLDYLIDDLIPTDSLLPSKHNFLWDRTRAIRIDLSVQKYNLTPDERTDLVYCLETIARFHVTALHLLSQDGFAAEDFSEQQEIEQLGKTLISLKELYDDCVEQGIECANEAEFRGYYIVFNARNPSIKETVEGWGTRLWNTSGIRTAMCLVESLQNTWTLQGPLNPHAPTELALGAAAMFFSIVSSTEISYTMACFAEIHFNDVRKSILQIVRKSYTRPRDGPKDITPAFLKERLRFDTEDEAIEFAQKHGIVFGQDGTHRYAILNTRQPIEEPRVRHAFSRSIVERKRSGHPLPFVIHQTVYQEGGDSGDSGEGGDEPAVVNQEETGLFVTDAENTPFDTPDLARDSESDRIDATTALPSSPPAVVNDQPPDPTPLFGASTKPSLFSWSDAGAKPLGAGAGAATATSTTTVSSGFLEPPPPPPPAAAAAAPARPQNFSAPNRSLFEQAPPPVAMINSGIATGLNLLASSPTPNSTTPPSGHVTHITGHSEEESPASPPSTLSSPEPAKPSNLGPKASSVAIPAIAMPKKDLMADFTRWFVLADRGLMKDELEPLAVEHLLRITWEEFKTAEKERARQEEDEKSWAEALKFRRYSLKVTFFYRWRDITRKRRIVKRIRLEKEKARLWNSPESVMEREMAERAKKEEAIREAKELVERRTRERAQEMTRMRESTRSQQSLEDALLATGVFNGLQDERAAARHAAAARDDDVDPESDISPAERLRLRSENQRRRRHGLPPLKRFPEARAPKPGTKTARLRAIASGAGRDSLSMSTSSLRNSTFSSSYRSSLGFNHSRVSKSRPTVSDPYWRMKANGMVLMPNGEYLHETLALPMLREGKRFPGLGDYGLPPEESFTPSQSPPAGLDSMPGSASSSLTRFRGNNQTSGSPSEFGEAKHKRKRDDQAEDEDLTAYRKEAPASRKRAKSGDRVGAATPSPDQDFLDSIANLMDRVNAVIKSTSSSS
ncbi:SAC3/GANP/Nin1/mts3/eIF-3 p25 family-domain-containing protein [Xylaria curta]|nr:SAC3/GANP/Nin1/mts3/eIF-3 p25 family-domain-containing protein [Xylaria curta]